MEKHKCKLCLRSFSNGRALGGHMRSHMMNLPLPPKDPLHDDQEAADSASSHSLPPPPPQQQHRRRDSDEEEEEEEEDEDDIDKSLYYGLRENPKRSVKLVDPEFSMILQDRESETESSKNPTRRRSKRARKPDPFFAYHHLDLHRSHGPCHDVAAAAAKGKGAESCWAEPEPVSSISDATTEEDVAFCLMMMSRDNWRRKKRSRREWNCVEEEEEDDEEEDDSDEDDEEEEESEFEEEDKRQSLQLQLHQRQRQETSKCPKSNRNNGGGGGNKYKCETCDKVFRSYQALGGHRASHKKFKLTHAVSSEPNDAEFKPRKTTNDGNAAVIVGTTPPAAEKKKVHECPVCFRVFASGQALGGHKRSHVIVVSHPETTPKQAAKTTAAVSPVAAAVEMRLNIKMKGESLIDLNLPAPDYDDCYDDTDEISQIELSAVSDAEFVNNTIIRQ